MIPVPVPDAAARLGIRPGTLRRWLRQGCPIARRGSRGRGRAVLVDPDAVRAWRAAVEQGDTGRARLLAELENMVPELVADAALHALAEASPGTQGGGELRRLRSAIASTARLASDSLLMHLRDKSRAGG